MHNLSLISVYIFILCLQETYKEWGLRVGSFQKWWSDYVKLNL